MARAVTSIKMKGKSSLGKCWETRTSQDPEVDHHVGWRLLCMWERTKGTIATGPGIGGTPPPQPTNSRRTDRLRLPTNQDENPGLSHSHGPLAVSWAQFPQNWAFSWGPCCFNFMLHQKSKMTVELRYLSLSQEFTLALMQAVTGSPGRNGFLCFWSTGESRLIPF